jgi:hypothetical protein
MKLKHEGATTVSGLLLCSFYLYCLLVHIFVSENDEWIKENLKTYCLH